MQLEAEIKKTIRDIPDYPKPGVVFKDISPLLASPRLVDQMLNEQVRYWAGKNIDAVAAIEARGFIFGSLLAHALKCPFIPVRKSGKLPYKTMSQDYSLEYGKASIEMHIDSIEKEWNVLVHDDLLATGGTAIAAGNLVQKLGGKVIGFSFLVNLSFLPGEKNLKEKFSTDIFYLAEY
ncbi:MAG TPA: adenine phosphoribosyltransferase [Cyclobacteriaceae bacterium]|nr:adenine phosphoribosyltransferase [Cyclobacteriaceae bacterium]